MTDPLSTWNEGPVKTAVLGVRREGGRRAAGRGPGGGLRQRRHPVVREADADPARLLPAPPRRDGRGRPVAARPAAVEGGARAGLRLAGRRRWPSTTPATTRTCRCWPAACWRRTPDITVEEFEAEADAFLRSAQHPTLGRGYLECAYAPMVELLGYLRANGFANYIASGGGRDFMRPIADEVYGIPRERRDRQRGRARVHAGRARAGRSPAKAHPTTSTTGRRSRCTSGAASGAGRCWRRATPTATSRCSTSPSTRTSRRCGSWCCTTTPSASSTTSPAPSRRSTGPPPRAGPWSASRTTGRAVF